MKLCYIGRANSSHMVRYCNYFAEKGHEVHLISEEPADIDAGYHETIRIHVVPPLMDIEFVHLFITAIKVRSIIRKIDPDILHAHTVTVAGFWGAFSGHHPYMITPWGSDITLDIRKHFGIVRQIIKFSLNNADIVQAVDRAAYDRLASLIADKSKIRLMKQMGVETDKFVPNKRTNGITKVIYLRPMDDTVYSTSTLIRSLSAVIKRTKGFILFMVDHGKDRKKIKKLIREKQLESYINFIDYIPHEKLPSVLAGFDLYVDTYYRDTAGGAIGLSPLEAMSCKVPVIYADTAGIEQYITDTKNGLVYKRGNHLSLAGSLSRLIIDKRLRAKIADNSRSYVKKEWEFRDNMKVIEKLYNALARIKPS